MKWSLFILLALALICPPAISAAPDKGLHPVKLTAQTQTGEKLTLYEQSHALLIGVSNYTQGWGDLENVSKELVEVKAVLEDQGFHVVGVSDPDAKTLERVFKDFINQYGYHKGNRLLFYFSGHGYSDGDNGYLVPTDAPDPGQNEVGFYRKALNMNQVMAWARGIRAKHALFLFDSCFSGTVFKAKNLPKKEERYIRKATSKPVRQFITAGSAGETVPARSTFTPAFVDALREGRGDLNHDGYVTGTELGVYLAQEVPRYEEQSPQYGKIKDYHLAQGDFVFFLPGGPLPGPGIIPPPPVRFLGHLQVNVTVAQEARVSVNGRLLGTASRQRPLNLSNLPAGKVEVRVTAKEHKPQTQWVTIRHGQWAQPVFSLEPIAPALAHLTVRSNVHGDKVYVNGEYKGSTRLDLDLSPGEYRITVSKQGYGDWEERIDLRSGAKKVLRARLEPSVISVVMPPGKVEKPKQKSDWRDPVTGMEFAWVPEGCFQMGSAEGNSDEKPVHEVCVDGFWVGKYEVTQGQWEKVMGNNPSYFKKGDNHPVERVSWNDVQGFIKKLNGKGQGGFRLPTEAEWEYACRSGGKKQKYCGGNDANRVAWNSESWGNGHHPIGKKAPNGLGLHDMSGNVWEWVSDWYDGDYYRNSPKNNPQGPSSGAYRVFRGGGCYYFPAGVRVANRYYIAPGYRDYDQGFRLLRTNP